VRSLTMLHKHGSCCAVTRMLRSTEPLPPQHITGGPRHPQTCTGTGGPCCPCRPVRTACEQHDSGAKGTALGCLVSPRLHRAAGQGSVQERQATPCASQESRHLLAYLPSVRRRTSCSTASSGIDSLGACQQFPQGAQEVLPVKGRRSVVSRVVSQRWTVQGSPGVLVRCTTAAHYSKVVIMSAE
jgi:hypothetical protein